MYNNYCGRTVCIIYYIALYYLAQEYGQVANIASYVYIYIATLASYVAEAS